MLKGAKPERVDFTLRDSRDRLYAELANVLVALQIGRRIYDRVEAVRYWFVKNGREANRTPVAPRTRRCR